MQFPKAAGLRGVASLQCMPSCSRSGLSRSIGRAQFTRRNRLNDRASDVGRARRGAVRAASEESADLLSSSREPEDVRGAIAIGLELYEEGKYQDALEVFEKGLKLPGTGIKRYRDKPRLISEGEKQSVLYNIACCYSRLEDARTGLVALAGCLESGYDDIAQLRSDPDLEFLRKDSRFEGLLSRFKLGPKKGLLEEFLGGFNL